MGNNLLPNKSLGLKMNRLKSVFYVVLVFLITACTASDFRDVAGKAAANAANSEVGYSSSQCFVVKQQCIEGYYEEWQTSDGTQGCSCAK